MNQWIIIRSIQYEAFFWCSDLQHVIVILDSPLTKSQSTVFIAVPQISPLIELSQCQTHSGVKSVSFENRCGQKHSIPRENEFSSHYARSIISCFHTVWSISRLYINLSDRLFWCSDIVLSLVSQCGLGSIRDLDTQLEGGREEKRVEPNRIESSEWEQDQEKQSSAQYQVNRMNHPLVWSRMNPSNHQFQSPFTASIELDGSPNPFSRSRSEVELSEDGRKCVCLFLLSPVALCWLI